jgi:uncharacterized protein YigE (DUF2233 family)
MISSTTPQICHSGLKLIACMQLLLPIITITIADNDIRENIGICKKGYISLMVIL